MKRSKEPAMQRPPARTRYELPRTILAGGEMLFRERSPESKARFNTPKNHRSGSTSATAPSRRPEPKRTPKHGILITFPSSLHPHIDTEDGAMLEINHRMQSTKLEERRGTGFHSAPPCPGKSTTLYSETYRHDDSLTSSPKSLVPLNESAPEPSYAKGGRVKKTGKATVHKGEVIIPKALGKQLNKLMKL